MAKVIINQISIRKKLTETLTKKKYAGLAYNAANTRFVFAKDGVIKEFNESPITKEIEAGPAVESNFLTKGNLVSFLGLKDGQEAVNKIKLKLQTSIRMNKTPEFSQTKTGVTYAFQVKTPTLEEIYDVAPSEWGSKSFVQHIQDGVSNFIFFIYDKTGGFGKWSRSGTGLQNKNVKKKTRSKKVLGIKWIDEILENFSEKFN